LPFGIIPTRPSCFYFHHPIPVCKVWNGFSRKRMSHCAGLGASVQVSGQKLWRFRGIYQQAFTAADVVELYLHRGAFEPALFDEDQEIEPDRWCSHSAWGQECWQVVAQWTWNLRLELGYLLQPSPLRITEFAPAMAKARSQAAMHPALPAVSAPVSGYGPPTAATSWKTGRFTGADFPLQPDGTLRCPAGQSLVPQEHRREADSSLRVVYAASIRNCRPCPLREQCQWNGNATKKPRQVSVLLHPLAVGREPLLWQDWSRREHRRACIHLIRSQRVEIEVQRGVGPPTVAPHVTSAPLSRAERAHTRLSWVQRLVRNAHPQTTRQITIRLFGVPAGFATSLSLASG
jgi:hypothetical protein